MRKSSAFGLGEQPVAKALDTVGVSHAVRATAIMNHSFAAQKSKGASGWLNVTSKRFAIEVRDAYRLF